VTRWYQLAVLAYPFLRNHAHLETPRREPYTYDDQTMNRVKAAIQLRYKMLPLWYTLFEAYHKEGAPVVRPLFWDFLDDDLTHTEHDAVENQIMLGDSVLVHGISEQAQKEANVYLPAGHLGSAGWYDLHTGSYFESGKYHKLEVTMDSIPAFYRAGSIVPLKSRIRRSSACMSQDPLTLAIYLTPAGTATGTLYLDDYRTQTYQDGKSFLKVAFEFSNGQLKATSTAGTLSADVSAEVEKIEIYGLQSKPDGAKLKVKDQEHKLRTSHVRELGSDKRVAAVVQLSPWLDLRDASWSLSL